MNKPGEASGDSALKDETHSEALAGEDFKTGESREDLVRRLIDLERGHLAQEHRMISVWANAIAALRGRENLPGGHLKAAVGALIRWLFLGRPLMLSVAIGSIVAAYLAFQANSLLHEQNQKLDRQNHLALVQSHQVYSQVYKAAMENLQALLNRIAAEKTECAAFGVGSKDGFCLPEGLKEELVEASLRFRPYRDLAEDSVGISHLHEGAENESVPAGLSIGDLPPNLEAMSLPRLSSVYSSPERGLLLSVLVREKISDITLHKSGLSLTGALSLEYAHVPQGAIMLGGKLDGADLDNAILRYIEADSSELSFASLRFADLSGSDFSNAEFLETDFRGASLREANLEGATVSGADFTAADLSYVIIDGQADAASFKFANLRGANLAFATGITSAQLSEACMYDSAGIPLVSEEYEQPAECSMLWPDASDGEGWVRHAHKAPARGERVRICLLEEDSGVSVAMPRVAIFGGSTSGEFYLVENSKRSIEKLVTGREIYVWSAYRDGFNNGRCPAGGRSPRSGESS